MEEKLISVTIWDPATALFKQSANARAEATFYYCQNPTECKLFNKHKQCVMFFSLGPNCVYGRRQVNVGPTKRSKNFRTWLENMNSSYKEVRDAIKGWPPEKMAEIGEYVYLPYSFMGLNNKVPFLATSGFGFAGKPFVKTEDFTVETIKEILNFRAMSLSGGEILEYRTKSIPLFLKHLKELYPHLYDRVIIDFPQFQALVSNVNRTAFLNTVQPGVVILDKEEWWWDGKQLTQMAESSTKSFGVVDINRRVAIKKIAITITPAESAVIKITREDQVGDNTAFVD